MSVIVSRDTDIRGLCGGIGGGGRVGMGTLGLQLPQKLRAITNPIGVLSEKTRDDIKSAQAIIGLEKRTINPTLAKQLLDRLAVLNAQRVETENTYKAGRINDGQATQRLNAIRAEVGQISLRAQGRAPSAAPAPAPAPKPVAVTPPPVVAPRPAPTVAKPSVTVKPRPRPRPAPRPKPHAAPAKAPQSRFRKWLPWAAGGAAALGLGIMFLRGSKAKT